MPSPILIAPSILSADFGRLQTEVESVKSADWLQLDVMDGHFVPTISFGVPVLRCLSTKLLIDVHLMVSNPADRIAEFLEAGAQHITFHAEAVPSTADRRALITAIRAGGATAGIAINPKTPVDAIADVAADVDLLLVMSVQPGFGGQEFIAASLDKVRALRAQFPAVPVQMDGGINAQTAPQCIAAGASNLVVGSFLFSAPLGDRSAIIQSLRHG